LNLTDTHTHLYSEEFDADRNEMMQKAIQAGVTRFFVPSIDASYTQKMYDLEKEYPENVFLMMGLHPCYVKPETFEQELLHVENELASKKFYAVGEIGIDLYWDKSTLEIQRHAFIEQINWAKELNLPIAIHARDAFAEIFDVLDEHADAQLSGVFHCFTGNQDECNKALSYPNFMLGIGGVATFKNGGLDKVLPSVPTDRIVLETDSPYLAPVPHRGKRNESAYLRLVAEKVAEIYQLPLAKVAEITTQNAKKLFKIN
jgi:TatD DNase family protein